MRSIAEIVEEQNRTAARLRELEVEKELAEKDAALPQRRRIRDRYVTIQRMLEQLDEMGENVGDVEGFALHIKGRSFEILPDGEVQEV